MPDQIGFFASLKNAAGKIFTYNDNLTTPTIVAGDLPYGSAAGVLSALAKGTANFKLFMDAAGSLPEWAAGIKIGSFARDMAAGSGDVSYSGVGFKPSLVFFSCATGGQALPYGAEVSIGWSNATNHYNLYYYHNVTAYTWISGQSACIQAVESNTQNQTAIIKTMDADGFTLTWTTTGTPTSKNLWCNYLALR